MAVPLAMISLDCSLYRLDKGGLSKASSKVLPPSLAAKAQAKFSHFGAAEKDPYLPGDFTHFFFRPQGSGLEVDFALPGTQDNSRKSIKIVGDKSLTGLVKQAI